MWEDISFVEEVLKSTNKQAKEGKSPLKVYQKYFSQQKNDFLLNRYDAPFNIKNFTKEFDINLEYSEVYNYSGRIKGNTIIINKLDINYRQRFTLAHELGHYFKHIDDDQERIDFYRGIEHPSHQINQKEEEEADYFAGEILMPKHLCTILYNELIKEYDEPDDFIHIMAKTFNVSKPAMIIRLKQANLIPKNKWVWFK